MNRKMQMALATALVLWLVWLGTKGQLAAFINLAASGQKPSESK